MTGNPQVSYSPNFKILEDAVPTLKGGKKWYALIFWGFSFDALKLAKVLYHSPAFPCLEKSSW